MNLGNVIELLGGLDDDSELYIQTEADSGAYQVDEIVFTHDGDNFIVTLKYAD
jgi:hypothetical protein